ncbi:MAG: hypothetical protein ACTTH5_04240 [Wolinella sp.]
MGFSRHSFTMIELVFAIVIVGFAILTIPVVVAQSNHLLRSSHNVQGYYHALALMQIIRIKPWDSANREDMNASDLYYVLDTDENAYDCKDVGGFGFLRREGMFARNFKGSRVCSQDSIKAKAIAGSSLETINFAQYSEAIKEYSASEDKFTLKAGAKYVDSSTLNDVANGTTNTKKITIELLDSSSGKLLARYHYYATNIGTDAIASKDL